MKKTKFTKKIIYFRKIRGCYRSLNIYWVNSVPNWMLTPTSHLPIFMLRITLQNKALEYFS